MRTSRASGRMGLPLLARALLGPNFGAAVALAGSDLQVLVSGTLVVETVFSWPGLGRITAEAVLGADYPLALAASLCSPAAVVGGRMLAAEAAPQLDPQLRSAEGET